MSELLLPVLHFTSMFVFLLILLDCVSKKYLINCCLSLNKEKKRLGRRNLENAKNIYEEKKLELKKAASDVVKEKLKDGQ